MVENVFVLTIRKWLQIVYCVNMMNEHAVHSWVPGLSEKWENILNDEKSSQRSNTSTDETRHAVLTIFECNQRFAICEIWDLLVDKHSIEVSHITVQHILATGGYTKVCVR